MWIPYLVENVAKVESRSRAIRPLDAPGSLEIERPYLVRSSEAIKARVLRGDRLRSPRLQVDDPARLPTFDDTGQNAMAVSSQALAGTNRQIERAVGPDDMGAVGSQQRVIRE